MLNVILLSAALLNVFMLSAIMLSAAMPNAIMISAVMLSVIILSAVMLNVIMLNVAKTIRTVVSQWDFFTPLWSKSPQGKLLAYFTAIIFR